MAAKNQRVQLTRPFRRSGEDIGVGSVIDIDLPTAQELRNAKKVEFVASDTKLGVVPFKPKVRPPTPEDKQLAAIEAQSKQVAALTDAVTALTELVRDMASEKHAEKPTKGKGESK